MSDASPTVADDDLDEVRRDRTAGFLSPVRNGVVVCWCCGGRMTGFPARLPIPCITCRHCGATIWFWPDVDDAGITQGAPPDRPLDRPDRPMRSTRASRPTTARAVAGGDDAERLRGSRRGHGDTANDGGV